MVHKQIIPPPNSYGGYNSYNSYGTQTDYTTPNSYGGYNYNYSGYYR